MSRYPVAYRDGADQYTAPNGSAKRPSGFQEGRPKLPVPSNDNLPLPANDNDLVKLLPEHKQKVIERRTAAAVAALDRQLLGRTLVKAALGPLGRAMDLYDVANFVGDIVYDVFDKKTPVYTQLDSPILDPAHWRLPPSWMVMPPNYTSVHHFNLGGSPHWAQWNNPEGPGGDIALPDGDWSSIGVGEGVNPVFHGNFRYPWGTSLLKDWYTEGQIATRLSTESDPWVSKTFQTTRIRLPRAGTAFEISPAEQLQHELNSTSVEPATESTPTRGTRNLVSASSIGRAPKLHVRRRRRYREKEVKMRTSPGVFKMVSIAINAATESADLIEAIWDALPDEPAGLWFDVQHSKLGWTRKPNEGFYKSGMYQIHVKNKETKKIETIWVQRRKPPPQVMLQEIYHNLAAVDKAKALENIVLNQLEDFAYGKAGQALGDASKKTRPHGDLPFGFGLGPAM